MNQAESPKPNWEEAFKGKDVVAGGELVNNLLSEEIGLPVYHRNPKEKQIRLSIDEEGNRDVSARYKEINNTRLLGILIPALDPNEFVYLGINESSFVLQVDKERSAEFHKDTSSSFTLNWNRFIDYINAYNSYAKNGLRLILKEESDPSRFTEVAISAVQKERERMQTIKEKRTSVRENLLNKLFGLQK